MCSSEKLPRERERLQGRLTGKKNVTQASQITLKFRSYPSVSGHSRRRPQEAAQARDD